MKPVGAAGADASHVRKGPTLVVGKTLVKSQAGGVAPQP